MPVSTATAARRRPPRPGARAVARKAAARRRRRRAGTLLVLLALGAGGAVAVAPQFDEAVREITLPLRHEDIIREQAAEKRLSPALIAAVINTESSFRDGQRSSAGALGLMQITPGTAQDIARRSGGSAFELADLASPEVNIAYGTYYLRYLHNRYDGNEALALAAYNGGEGNVDRWLGEASAAGRRFTPDQIPFPETKAYVAKVRAAKREYRTNYARELGLDG